MKIGYNSRFILDFSLLCTLIMILATFFGHWLVQNFFSVPPADHFSWSNPLNYIRLFSHSLGHSGWEHLSSNLTFILLLGPMLEEKYGSKKLLIMVVITAGITGLINALFFSTGLMGASGIVFMFIILSSFTNYKSKEIPLTFIIIACLFITKEVVSMTAKNNISEFAHILGGIMGSSFGFLWNNK